MQIGNTNFNVEALKDISEKEFKARFRKTMDSDIDKAWKNFKKEAQKFKKATKSQSATKKK